MTVNSPHTLDDFAGRWTLTRKIIQRNGDVFTFSGLNLICNSINSEEISVDIVKKKWKHIEVEYESPKNEETKHEIYKGVDESKKSI